MKKEIKLLLVTLLVLMASGVAAAKVHPRQHFVSAWMSTVYQEGYSKRSAEENKAYLRKQLDLLKQAGVTAVIFQIRPRADAFYFTETEPWSRWLTGKNGLAPTEKWDPLQFMVEETHKRKMELHAWMNPYLVANSKETLSPKSVAKRHPEWVFRYGTQLYLNPGIPECRDYIVGVVNDVVTRYDVDAIHFDDYFYPYPNKGESIPDAATYRKYGAGLTVADWRRGNVNALISNLHKAIHEIRPSVKLGISPFGIVSNKIGTNGGSATSGLQCYDDLYADVMLWAKEGWIDYLMPQLYWELEHKRASWRVLVEWWCDNIPEGCKLYIGQDVRRTMDAGELAEKVRICNKLKRVDGMSWWPAYDVTGNYKGILDELRL